MGHVSRAPGFWSERSKKPGEQCNAQNARSQKDLVFAGHVRTFPAESKQAGQYEVLLLLIE